MGWGSVFKAIAGVAAAPFTGGASLIPMAIGLGSDVAQSVIAHKAEGKGAKQQSAAFQKAADVYNPAYARGNAAGDTLAGYLGLDVPEGGFGAPAAMGAPAGPQGPLPWATRTNAAAAARAAASQSQPPQSLAQLFASSQPDDQRIMPVPMSRPQTPSAKSRSSYRAEEMN